MSRPKEDYWGRSRPLCFFTMNEIELKGAWNVSLRFFPPPLQMWPCLFQMEVSLEDWGAGGELAQMLTDGEDVFNLPPRTLSSLHKHFPYRLIPLRSSGLTPLVGGVPQSHVFPSLPGKNSTDQTWIPYGNNKVGGGKKSNHLSPSEKKQKRGMPLEAWPFKGSRISAQGVRYPVRSRDPSRTLG